MSTDREGAVREVFESWCRAWRTVDVELMKSVFDGDDPGFIYQSEEAPLPLKTASELNVFWDNAGGLMPGVPEWRELETDISFFGDIAVMFTRIQAIILVEGVKEPITGPIRCTIVLREVDSGWRIVHYHESRQADLAAFGLEDVPLYHTLDKSES